MKKWLKITIIAVSVVVLILGLAALFISPAAKYYLEKNSKELIGRQIKLEKLRVNIFTGSLEMDSVRMYEKDDKQIFASIDTFKVNIELTRLLSKDIEIKEIRVIAPHANIWQKGDLFNFSDLIKKDTATVKDTTKSDFPRSIVLKNIYINGGKLVYTDKLLNNTLKFNDLGVSIPELQLGKGSTKAGIRLKIGDKATLASHLSMDMKTNNFTLSLAVKHLPINIMKPYLLNYYEINEFEGDFNSDVKIAGNTDHIMNFILNGKADVNNVILTNKRNEPIISTGNMSVKIKKIDMNASQYLFDFIKLSDVDLSYVLHPKTDNITALFPPAKVSKTDTAKTTSAPMVFRVTQFNITHSTVNYTDNTLKKAAKIKMHNIEFQSDNFDMSGINLLKGKASFDNNGKLLFTWRGSINDLKNQDITVKIVNFDLKTVSPYCYEYTAYDLTDGKLNFETKNGIKNNYINSTNVVDVYKINVSKKHKEFKPEYNLPLKTALYILKDKDDKINFVIPVKGNINDPQFKYWRIVMKTLGNLMVKVAVSPFKFLGNALGVNGKDQLETIPFEPMRKGFTTDEYAKIDELLNTLSTKPELTLKLTQYISLNNDELDKYGLFRLKESYLKTQNTTQPNAPVSYDEVSYLSDNDHHLATYINTLTEGKTPQDASLKDKIRLVYPADTLKSALIRSMNFRNEALKKYMIESGKVKAPKITVTSAASDSLINYTDKALFKVNIGVEGDE